MASQVLPDGSEKGLSGYNTERMPRRRIGLAPPAGDIDRNPPYKRIATEEAWTFAALVKAQVDYLESADAPRRSGIADGRDVRSQPEPAEDAPGPGRTAHRSHGRIRHRPAAPAADRAGRAGAAAGGRDGAGARGQRHRRRGLPPVPGALLGLRGVRSAGCQGIGQGDRARDDRTEVERGGAQLAFPGAVHRRAGIRADRGGAGGARRGALHTPDRAVVFQAVR